VQQHMRNILTTITDMTWHNGVYCLSLISNDECQNAKG